MLVPNTKTPQPKTKRYVRVLNVIADYLVVCSLVLVLYFAVLTFSLSVANLIHYIFDGGA